MSCRIVLRLWSVLSLQPCLTIAFDRLDVTELWAQMIVADEVRSPFWGGSNPNDFVRVADTIWTLFQDIMM